jgi:thymidylate kinase
MIINILGTDGVGKTTHIYRLMSDIQQSFNISTRVVAKSDMLDTVKFPETKFIGVSYETLAVECLPLMKGCSRAMWLLYMFSVILGRYTPQSNEIILMDGYWHKHYGTEAALGVDGEWIKKVCSIFPQPDFSVFLDLDPEKVLKREGKMIKPYECGLDIECKPESFLKHQSKVRENLKNIIKEYNSVTIDADNDIEIIYQKIKAEVFNQIKNKLPL